MYIYRYTYIYIYIYVYIYTAPPPPPLPPPPPPPPPPPLPPLRLTFFVSRLHVQTGTFVSIGFFVYIGVLQCAFSWFCRLQHPTITCLGHCHKTVPLPTCSMTWINIYIYIYG